MSNYHPFVPPGPGRARGGQSDVARLDPGTRPFGSFGTMGHLHLPRGTIVFAYIGFDLNREPASERRRAGPAERQSRKECLARRRSGDDPSTSRWQSSWLACRPYGQARRSRTRPRKALACGRRRVGPPKVVNLGALTGVDDGDHGRPDRAEPGPVQHGPRRSAAEEPRPGQPGVLLPLPAPPPSQVLGRAGTDALTRRSWSSRNCWVIGALFCFAFCAVGVLTLRRSEPQPRNAAFRVPMVPLIPLLLSLAATVWLMLNLKTSTLDQVRRLGWSSASRDFTGLYGRWHSRPRQRGTAGTFDLGDTDPRHRWSPGSSATTRTAPPKLRRHPHFPPSSNPPKNPTPRQTHAQLTPRPSTAPPLSHTSPEPSGTGYGIGGGWARGRRQPVGVWVTRVRAC